MLKLFITNLKMLFRNRQSLFWAFMFPVMFTCIFGFFFGKDTTSGTVAVVNNSDSKISSALVEALDKSNLFKVTDEKDEEKAKKDITLNKISAAIIVPKDFGNFTPNSPTKIKVIIDQGNAQTNAIITGFLDQFLTQTNYQVQNAKPIYTLEEEKVSDKTLNYFDFVLAGILGLSLMNSSVIGIAVGMSKYREDKILKRITTTPVKSSSFIIAEVLSRLIINILQISVVLIIGIYFFDAHIYGNFFILFGVALLGAILFQLLGFVVASFSKTTDAAQGMTTAITIPMMFLAGVFFPIDALPKWLYSVVQYLPLAPLLRMIREVALQAESPFINPANIIIVISWIVVCLAIASFKFRLSEE